MPLDFVALVDDIKSYERSFFLHPRSWQAFKCVCSLDWHWVKFGHADLSQIPLSRGLYAFVVEPEIPNVFQVGFPMYVGETGNNNSRTLRDRYQEYLRHRNKVNKRPNIHVMARKWPDHLFFYFATVSDTAHNLTDIEAALNDALIPVYTTGDFSAEVRPLVGALRR